MSRSLGLAILFMCAVLAWSPLPAGEAVRSVECGLCVSDRDLCYGNCADLKGESVIGCHLKCRAASKACEERNDCRSSTFDSPRRLALLDPF